MSLVRKFKPDRSIIGALIPLSMFPLFGVAALVVGWIDRPVDLLVGIGSLLPVCVSAYRESCSAGNQR